MITVAVIIPYYQRERGILRATLDTVAAQVLPPDVRLRIIVVDDESPLPLADALEGFDPPAPHELVLLKRPNGGPGAARNTALDSLDPGEVRYVAFVDSDDFWFEHHLAEAVDALSNGADFYFCNSEHDARDSFYYSIYVNRHHRRDGDRYEPKTRSIDGEEAVTAFIRECIPHTSQVVYDFGRHRDVRFDENQRRAGEDHLFWVALASNARRVTYSTSVNGARGRGISIYRETLSWDSENAPNRLIDELLFRRKLTRLYGFNREQRREIARLVQSKRDHLLFLSLRNLRSRARLTGEVARRVTRDIPSLWLHLPWTLLRLPLHVRMLRRTGSEQH